MRLRDDRAATLQSECRPARAWPRSRPHDRDEVSRSAFACALETCRAGEQVSEAVALTQPEARAIDLESERTLEHPQMMLQSRNGRCVEGHQGSSGHNGDDGNVCGVARAMSSSDWHG